jgi:hypothetical protein
MVDRNSVPLNTATIGGALPSPLPFPPKAVSPNGLPSPINVPNARPRYNSQARLSPNSPSLPMPGTPPVDGFPFPSPSANPHARPISAVLARPRTGSAGAEAMSRLSLNGLSLNSGPLLGFDSGVGSTSNKNARPVSLAFGTSSGQSPRNSLNPGVTSPDEFGGMGGQTPISRSWNGRSVLGSGRPQTPLGLGGGGLELKPGKSSKLVVSPSARPGASGDSTEDESEAANESEDDGLGYSSASKSRPAVA